MMKTVLIAFIIIHSTLCAPPEHVPHQHHAAGFPPAASKHVAIALGIPTHEDQMNVLKHAHEVFRELKKLVDDEGTDNDVSVVADVQKAVNRAEEYFHLMEEVALLKMQVIDKKTGTTDVSRTKKLVSKITVEGISELQRCVTKVSDDVKSSSLKVSHGAEKAANIGKTMLNTLAECAKKPGIQQLSCYRRVLAKDVNPVKEMLIDAINLHKSEHARIIGIREFANDCIDSITALYQEKLLTAVGDVFFDQAAQPTSA